MILCDDLNLRTPPLQEGNRIFTDLAKIRKILNLHVPWDSLIPPLEAGDGLAAELDADLSGREKAVYGFSVLTNIECQLIFL